MSGKLRPIDGNGFVPDEPSRESDEPSRESHEPAKLDVMLELAELRGFVRAMAIVAAEHVKRLDALTALRENAASRKASTEALDKLTAKLEGM